MNFIEKLKSVPYKIKRKSPMYEKGIWYVHEIDSSGNISICTVPNWDGDEEKYPDVDTMAWVNPEDLTHKTFKNDKATKK
jgi:hypothetical protein